MLKSMNRHPAIYYYIFILLISGFLLAIQNIYFANMPAMLLLPQFSPAIAVFLILKVTKDKKGFERVKKDLHIKNTSFQWILAAVGIPAIFSLITGFILSLLGISFSVWHILEKPWYQNTVVFVLILVFMAFGCLMEEIGWRSYLTPTLEQKYIPLISAMIVGFLWGIWHLNLGIGVLGFICFVFSCIEMSILMRWLYQKCSSVIVVAIWHLATNLANQIFLTNRLNATGFLVFDLVLLLPCIVCLFGDKTLFFTCSQNDF